MGHLAKKPLPFLKKRPDLFSYLRIMATFAPDFATHYRIKTHAMSIKKLMKGLSLSILAVATSLIFVNPANASDDADTTGGADFNAGEMILHHVQDAHELHIFTAHVPLPIIIWDEGLTIFSSSNFYGSEEKHIGDTHYYEHDGFVLVHEKIYKVTGALGLDEDGHLTNTASVLDLSITKNVAGMLLGVFLMFWFFLSAAKGYKKNKGKAPKGMQALIEPLVMFIRDDVAKPAIGHKYERYMPFLLSLFFFIWIGNMIGLIPFLGGINFTGNIAVTAVLALITFLITSFSGNKAYWSHIFMPPGVPIALYPILVPIEIIGMFSKPFVLMLRLFANVTAGHIIILAFTFLIFIMKANMGDGAAWGSSVVAVIFSVFMNFLELLVAFLQAYVFLLLAALYFGSAVEEAHH